MSIGETWASPRVRPSSHPPTIHRITFTFAHHAVPSLEGMWRSGTTSALTPNEAKIYGNLKIALAERYREGRPAYNTAKGEFVEELTSRAIAVRKK
jgi:hypothetical protein